MMLDDLRNGWCGRVVEWKPCFSGKFQQFGGGGVAREQVRYALIGIPPSSMPGDVPNRNRQEFIAFSWVIHITGCEPSSSSPREAGISLFIERGEWKAQLFQNLIEMTQPRQAAMVQSASPTRETRCCKACGRGFFHATMNPTIV